MKRWVAGHIRRQHLERVRDIFLSVCPVDPTNSRDSNGTIVSDSEQEQRDERERERVNGRRWREKCMHAGGGEKDRGVWSLYDVLTLHHFVVFSSIIERQVRGTFRCSFCLPCRLFSPHVVVVVVVVVAHKENMGGITSEVCSLVKLLNKTTFAGVHIHTHKP